VDGSFRLFTNGDFEDDLSNWTAPVGGSPTIVSSGGYGDNGKYLDVSDNVYVKVVSGVDIDAPSSTGIDGNVRMQIRAASDIENAQLYYRFNDTSYVASGFKPVNLVANEWKQFDFFFEEIPWNNDGPIDFWFVPSGFNMDVDSAGFDFNYYE
jgi:hypothetical protein